MKNVRWMLLTFIGIVAVPAVVMAAFQTQRAQIQVTITINVTPAPLAMRQHAPSQPAAADGAGFITRLALNRAEKPRAFSAQSVHFVDGNLVAAAPPNQGAVKVEAQISPNPNATILTSNQTGVVINQTAGTTMRYSCIYSITADTTQAAWTLDHGLFSNFASIGGDTFAGGNVANNTYLSTPKPTATPFVVYQTDGGTWVAAATGAQHETFCVDLTVKLPLATPQGTFSSNAVYTLFF